MTAGWSEKASQSMVETRTSINISKETNFIPICFEGHYNPYII